MSASLLADQRKIIIANNLRGLHQNDIQRIHSIYNVLACRSGIAQCSHQTDYVVSFYTIDSWFAFYCVLGAIRILYNAREKGGGLTICYIRYMGDGRGCISYIVI